MLFHNIKGVPDFECHEYEEKKNKYCLCIPIINEKENITLELHRARINKVHTICDIIICDGGSTDGGTDEDMLRGLFVAAGVGAICYTRTKPTGEEIGCAGECGCCCAMAAAAVVEMTNGTPEQIDAAASMAMQLAIGWPCDVIPGGSGAPCTARIMAVAVMSIVFAQWALIDEDPIIPFHEALDAAAALGENMHPDLLCTGRGGMCVTPSAKKCAAALQAARQKKN